MPAQKFVSLCLRISLLSALLVACTEIKPPGQEGAGPGDNDYVCDTDTGLFVERNDEGIEYMGKNVGGYIYAPACAERPDESPVVFFFHMFIAEEQDHYNGFFRHLAGKGYVVIAPSYNTPGTSGNLLLAFNEEAIDTRDRGVAGANAGLMRYISDIVPAYDVPAPKFEEGELIYGVVGHSYGGPIGLALANPAIRGDVPGVEDFDWNPKALVMMATGKGSDVSPRCPGAFEQAWCCPSCSLGLLMNLFGWVDNGYLDPEWTPDPDKCPLGDYVEAEDGQHCMVTDATFLCGDLADITYDPLMIVMSGEDDTDVAETAPLLGYCAAVNIADRQYIRVRSDDHGEPFTNDLVANHTDALGADLVPVLFAAKVDGHDYWGYWKIVTAAMNCAVYDLDCEYARGGTEEQLSMGYWSDGQAVRAMQWNPRVRDNTGTCYDLGDASTPGTACCMVNNGTWDWRGPAVVTDCGD